MSERRERRGRRGQVLAAAVAILSLPLVGTLDVLSGPEVSVAFLYLLPVALATWLEGLLPGLLTTAGASVIWLFSAGVVATPSSHAAIPVWNALALAASLLPIPLLVAALRRAHRRMAELERADPLTGALSPRSFRELVETELDRARRYQGSFTVAYIDLDDFQIINERFGHGTGDAVLRVVAQTIKKSIRPSDVVARLGGDEFAILLLQTTMASAEAAVGRVRLSLRQAIADRDWPLTFTIGAVSFLTPPRSFDEVIARVEKVMLDTIKIGERDGVYYEC